MAVIAKFCGGVFSAFLLETELLDIKITDSIIKSFNNTMQHAVVKNDKMDIAAFQEAEDLAIKQFINTGKDFFLSILITSKLTLFLRQKLKEVIFCIWKLRGHWILWVLLPLLRC